MKKENNYKNVVLFGAGYWGKNQKATQMLVIKKMTQELVEDGCFGFTRAYQREQQCIENGYEYGYASDEWHQNSGADIWDTSTTSERNAYMTYSAVAGDLPHYCTRYAGDGSETDLVFTFEFDMLVEMRFVLFYQLIPVDNLMA